ncbi:prolyl oligopeptidase family serine peptidase [Bradyrhizobium sp. DOA9]|uniref:prolyl oligopeptidase family serine peptidase n=1 Tax=Bradyrhizobium sp. DOA9 TaxID=1126627 RepID=UPI001FCD45A6|nr:prolyl oligopeptidase family serine peptidase [Bradyrhizobium sp. DOA9]
MFETSADHLGVSCHVERRAPTATVWFIDRPDLLNLHIYLGSERGAIVKLALPSDIQPAMHRDFFAFRLRSAWTVAGVNYERDSLLGISVSAFLVGDRKFAVLFQPSPCRALQDFFWAGNKLVLSILEELRPVIEICDADYRWARETLPGLPQVGVVDVRPFDQEQLEGNGDLLVETENPITPGSLSLIEGGVGSPIVLRPAPRLFIAQGLVVSQHEAVSTDGERIPYIQTGPVIETGNAPVHMTGDGGFGLSVRPHYDVTLGKLWLERGGTAVQAALRRGGEFGASWHDAGRGAGKTLSHDDFAAVAADLVRRGVTQYKRIAAAGCSNGGLLIANMLTRYPDRFGALLCTLPLVDMRRYTTFSGGASWIAEYGDPSKPDDWEWLKSYSAYHAAEPDRPYPPILITATRHDDRVHPGHTRKMLAKLQSMKYEAYLYEVPGGERGLGWKSESATLQALGLQFLKRKIGWRDYE